METGKFIAVIFAFSLFKFGECIRPAIVEGIVDEVRPVDSTATLNCTVSLFNNAPDNVQWQRIIPGNPIKTISTGSKIVEQNPQVPGDMLKYEVRISTGRTHFIPNMGFTDVQTFTLLIRRLHNGDAGVYKCRINIPGDPANSPEVSTHLIVPREPYIDPSQVTNNQVVEEFTNVTMSCTAVSQPQARISWIRANGQPLNLPGRPQRVYGETFTLNNVTKFDRGVYRCHANNNVGYGAKHDVRLDVNYKPSVRPARLYGMYLQAPDRNFEVTLECISSGFPDPEVSFYKGRHVVNDVKDLPTSALIKNEFPFSIERLRSQGAVNTEVNEIFYSLRITNVLSNHFDNYTCVAANKYGLDTTYLQLLREEVCQGPLCFGSGSIVDGGAAASLRPSALAVLLLLLLLLSVLRAAVN